METETFQHYQVLRRDDGSLWELGRGAMGVTYKAFDVNLRCNVALKVVNAQHLDSEVARQRFLREARAAAALRHRNIASVFHLGESGGGGGDLETFFYSMEFIDGETVEHMVTRLGPLHCADALQIAVQVSRALGAASKQGLVHRDIKPANIMVLQEDEEDQFIVKVIDFGLARKGVGGAEQSGNITVSGFVGTPQYASPEQIEEQDLDSRSDIYSLGVTLWYMMVGQPPFTGSIFRISSQHLTKEPPWEQLKSLPQPVQALLMRMLKKDPASRPQNPVKLRLEIEACLRELPPEERISVLPAPMPASASDSQAEPPSSSAATMAEAPPTPESSSSEAMAAEATRVQGPAPAVGVILAERYALLEMVGEGSLGQVFRATDSQASQREVAIKALHVSSGMTPQEFYGLQSSLGLLRASPHPLLLEVFAFEQVRGYRFIVEEWVNGFTLVDLLRTRGRLLLREALHVLNEATQAAAHCSTHGLHRLELSPHQIFVHFPGLPGAFEGDEGDAIHNLRAEPLARWPEFGLKLDALSPTIESTGAPTLGGEMTLAPSSPRVPGRDTQSSILGFVEDSYIYALAALFFEMIGGQPPPAPTEKRGLIPPLAYLNEGSNELLRRALSPNPGFASEGEFFDALLRANDVGRASILMKDRAAIGEPVPPVDAKEAHDSQAGAETSHPVDVPAPEVVAARVSVAPVTPVAPALAEGQTVLPPLPVADPVEAEAAPELAPSAVPVASEEERHVAEEPPAIADALAVTPQAEMIAAPPSPPAPSASSSSVPMVDSAAVSLDLVPERSSAGATRPLVISPLTRTHAAPTATPVGRASRRNATITLVSALAGLLIGGGVLAYLMKQPPASGEASAKKANASSSTLSPSPAAKPLETAQPPILQGTPALASKVEPSQAPAALSAVTPSITPAIVSAATPTTTAAPAATPVTAAASPPPSGSTPSAGTVPPSDPFAMMDRTVTNNSGPAPDVTPPAVSAASPGRSTPETPPTIAKDGTSVPSQAPTSAASPAVAQATPAGAAHSPAPAASPGDSPRHPARETPSPSPHKSPAPHKDADGQAAANGKAKPDAATKPDASTHAKGKPAAPVATPRGGDDAPGFMR